MQACPSSLTSSAAERTTLDMATRTKTVQFWYSLYKLQATVTLGFGSDDNTFEPVIKPERGDWERCLGPEFVCGVRSESWVGAEEAAIETADAEMSAPREELPDERTVEDWRSHAE